MHDLQRIQYVTSHYQEIQGLRIIPFGIWLILVALGQASGFVPTTEPKLDAAILFTYLLGGFLVLALYGLIGTFYERTYGSVQPLLQSRTRALSGCLSGAGFLGVLYIGMMVGQRQLATEVAILLSFLLIYATWRSHWYRKDYVVLAALLIGAHIFPFRTNVMALNGIVVVVGGLLDHFLLVRTLKHVPEERHAGRV